MVSLFSQVVASLLALSTVANAFPLTNTLTKRTPTPAGPAVHITTNNVGEYTRVSRMNDGALIAGYVTTEGAQSVLKTAKSTDGGNSWTLLGEVFRGDKATHDINNAFPMQLPNGRVLYAYRNHDRTGSDWHYTYFRISISYSDDGGVNSKYLSTVDERVPSGVNGLWEPYLRIARDGSIQCYYSAENANNDQDNLMRYSTDGGSTWSQRITVSGSGITSRDGMVGVAPVDNDGNMIAVFENTESSTGFTVSAVLSSNDGLTWGNRLRLYNPTKGAAGAPQVFNVWGTLVVSFMTNESHDVGNSYDGGDMKVIISTDAGKTWSAPFITGPSPAHWPGLFNLDPTHFMALYSQDGNGPMSRVFAL